MLSFLKKFSKGVQSPIIIDACIFSLQKNGGGISVAWRNILEKLSMSDVAGRIYVISWKNTAPHFPNLQYIHLDMNYSHKSYEKANRKIDSVCRKYRAALFISSYHTYTGNVPTLQFVYDFVPEILGWDLQTEEWFRKAEAIRNSDYFLCISYSTAADLKRIYPEIPQDRIRTIHLAHNTEMPSAEAIAAFREKYGLHKKYFLLSGHRWPHKNHILLLKAINTGYFVNRDVEIVFSGGARELESWVEDCIGDFRIHRISFSDQEMSLAYAGAEALVYPSKYEGFGLPVLEAMSCDCPVITCRNSSLEEIGGDAAAYVAEDDSIELAHILNKMCDDGMRREMIEKGRLQAGSFSWERFNGEFTSLLDNILNNLESGVAR